MAKEYIDRKVVKNAIIADGYEHFSSCLSSSEKRLLELMLDSVSEIPAEDVTEVRHGTWLLEREPDGKNYCFHCSACDSGFSYISIYNVGDWNYCPNCGAKMDGGEEQ